MKIQKKIYITFHIYPYTFKLINGQIKHQIHKVTNKINSIL